MPKEPLRNFPIRAIHRLEHFSKTNIMAKSESKKIRVGIFVVVGTILLIGTLYFIGKRQHLFSRNIELSAVFSNVNGLQVGNNVRYSGINVGTVSDIEMKKPGEIVVKMSVEEKLAYFMKTDAIASIGSDGLVGSMVVNIVPGENPEAKTVESGDTIQAQGRLAIDDMLSTLNKTNENAAILSEDLLKITNQVLEGKGTLGAIINDTILAHDIRQMVVELRNTTQGASVAVNRVNGIISKINYDESAASVILSDTASANQIRKVFVNLEKSSEDINAITKNLEEYINEVKSGKGAINHITQDEDFAKEVDSTMVNIKEAAQKLNQNMEALKHNFLFRGYFKRLERQERKDAKEK